QDVAQTELVIQSMEAPVRLAFRGLVELRLKFGRPCCGRVSSWSTHRTELLSLHGPTAGPSLGQGCVVPSPGGGTMPRSYSLLGACTCPRRASPVPRWPLPTFRVPYTGGFF